MDNIQMEFFSRLKKYKKYHKIWYKNNKRYFCLSKKFFGLKCNKSYRIRISLLKLLLKKLKKFLKPYGKKVQLKLRVFPDIGVTKKPRDIRMGRGKGNVVYKEAYIKGGMILIEILNILDYLAIKILKKCSLKIGIPCTIVFSNDRDYNIYLTYWKKNSDFFGYKINQQFFEKNA